MMSDDIDDPMVDITLEEYVLEHIDVQHPQNYAFPHSPRAISKPTATASLEPPESPFTALPLELRHAIYSFAIPGPFHEIFESEDTYDHTLAIHNRHPRDPTMSLLLVNRQLNLETKDFYLLHRGLRFHGVRSLSRFLQRNPPSITPAPPGASDLYRDLRNICLRVNEPLDPAELLPEHLHEFPEVWFKKNVTRDPDNGSGEGGLNYQQFHGALAEFTALKRFEIVVEARMPGDRATVATRPMSDLLQIGFCEKAERVAEIFTAGGEGRKGLTHLVTVEGVFIGTKIAVVKQEGEEGQEKFARVKEVTYRGEKTRRLFDGRLKRSLMQL